MHANTSSARRIGLGAALAFAVLAAAPAASAYCRTASCPINGESHTGARCDPSMPTDCGKVLFWSKPCVSFSLQQDASKQVTLETTKAVFTKAFQTWMEADCGGGKHPRIQLVDYGTVPCHKHEYNKELGNANIILYHDDVWPHPGAGSTLALTTVTYNVDTGEIYDADMEINAATVTLTTGDTGVMYDLHSIATHEAGHFLGLSHSPEPTATMFADYAPGSIELRTLSPDDINGICAAYPPGEAIPAACDATPRHGFSGLCAEDQPPPEDGGDGGCCSAAPGAPDGHTLPALAAALSAMLIGAARRRKERAGRR